MNKSKFKLLFNKTYSAALRYNKYKLEFDKAIQEIWGTHYSEHNEDIIIDAIDYGGGGIDFEYFCELMDRCKEEIENEN